jgi:glycosyltransferase involved in cell wall biosynthesis
MNLQQLRYRIGIGGLPWVAKTALGMARNVSPSKRSSPATFELGSSSPAAPRILYLHSGWAIETVGRLWFTHQSLARVTFMKADAASLSGALFAEYDLIWYGYSSLYRRHPCDPAKAVIAVHDPAELFSEDPQWKGKPVLGSEKHSLFRAARAVVVISKEMEEVLASAGVTALRIPTCSTIPARCPSAIPANDAPSLLAVGRIYRRKNFEQFQRIASKAASTSRVSSYLKGDHFPLSEENYIRLVDRHSIYLCTSYQEGGPLPVMDAMRRGALVLSTPVGQVPEIILHGVNGFICTEDAEFLEIIKALGTQPKRLHDMRLLSLQSISASRNEPDIAAHSQYVLQTILNR